MHVTAVLETVLYADDVAASTRFYTEVLGIRAIAGPDDHSAALRLPDGGVLLIFDPARSAQSGRGVPAHGATGPGHIAFSVAPGTLGASEQQLREAGIAIEREVTWARGGRSVYVRDPAGNSVEFVDGELWER